MCQLCLEVSECPSHKHSCQGLFLSDTVCINHLCFDISAVHNIATLSWILVKYTPKPNVSQTILIYQKVSLYHRYVCLSFYYSNVQRSSYFEAQLLETGSKIDPFCSKHFNSKRNDFICIVNQF